MLMIHLPEAEANSRPVGLRFALMTLRLLEHWRSYLKVDHDSAIIVLATAAITMEKFTRGDFEPTLRDIRFDMPAAKLTKCNVSSIAAATGLNRETTRRKVKALIAGGILLRDGRDSIRLNADFTRNVRTSEMLRSLLETLVHSANELARDGVLQSQECPR
jgi:hypothetical protein